MDGRTVKKPEVLTRYMPMDKRLSGGAICTSLAVGPFLVGLLGACLVAQTNSPLQDRAEAVRTTPVNRPIIWCFSGKRDKSDSLAAALRSKLVTHVAFFVGNRKTSDTLHKASTTEAIALAKKADDPPVKLILVRFLWQTQPSPDSELSAMTNVDYYVREIEHLRREARLIGADLVAFDTETYGPTAITAYSRSKEFTQEAHDEIARAVDEAVRRVGKVDFTLPAGSSRRYHPYMAWARLGQRRISEGTYYDDPKRISKIRYPYEIAGMYVNVTKENERHPWNRYFLPSDVFGARAGVWKGKEGLMIWPRENRADEVARMLESYARDQRRAGDERETDSP
jgi:hypothetical protein